MSINLTSTDQATTPLANTPLATATTLRAESLRGLAGGQVYLPGDAGYDGARMPWNVAVDQQPAAVALPRTAADVAEVVLAAAAAGLRVAPQSTGHNAGPLAARGLDDVVVVRTSELNEVHIDAETRTARVGGGTLWQGAVEAAAAHGLAVCTDRPPTWASPATRSVAASAGTPASSAWRPTA